MTSIIRNIILILTVFISAKSFSAPIVIAEGHTLNSSILKEDRQLQVYLPESYKQGDKHYPVLYVIDGQRYFLHAIAHQQTLLFQEKTPELIVIGLTTDSRKRRQWLYPKRQDFMAFLSDELIPWVDKNYRTSSEKLYFGWEMAAGLVPDLIVQKPTLFQAFFMASPTHINKQRVDDLTNYLRNPTSEHLIYASLGTVETWATSGMKALEQAVTSAPKHSISWKYDLLEDQDHYTTPLITIDNGLLEYFKDYGPIRFYSIKEFNEYGGLPALRQHYQARGKRFGISDEIHDDTKHYLINQSLKEDNLALFAELEGSFEGFVAHYYRVEFWFERLANAYIKLNNYNRAEEILEIGVNKLPNSHKLYAALARINQLQQKQSKARQLYATAIELAKEDNKALLQYENALKEIIK